MNAEQSNPEESRPSAAPPADWEALHRLTKDLRNAGAMLTDTQARYFVDAYYLMQKLRIRSGNQVKALERDFKREQEANPGAKEEPHDLLDWLGKNQDLMESNIKASLGRYANSRVAGVWAQSICGIGPVIAAGLLAHIDIEPWVCRNEKAKISCRESEPCTPQCGKEILHTVGHIWRFAGQDPTSKWEPKTRRPWNAALKTLCWKLGESFVKVSNNEADVYGKVYQQRKEYEQRKNEALDYKDQAALGAERVGKKTEAYKSYVIGKLPDGHIHARAKRYAVKLFLSGFHEALYFHRYGKLPPKPYVLEHLGHTKFFRPPNMEVIPGWKEARDASKI